MVKGRGQARTARCTGVEAEIGELQVVDAGQRGHQCKQREYNQGEQRKGAGFMQA